MLRLLDGACRPYLSQQNAGPAALEPSHGLIGFPPVHCGWLSARVASFGVGTHVRHCRRSPNGLLHLMEGLGSLAALRFRGESGV